MKLRHKSSAAFTLIELLVVISIIAILAALAVPAISKGMDRAKVIQTVSNGKQIAISATVMANDGASSGDPKQGWPGDLAAATPPPVAVLGDYIKLLNDYEYLKPGDIIKLFSGPTVTAWDGSSTFTTANSVFKVFKVTGSDIGSVVFLETKNYTYNTQNLNPAGPFGQNAFVIVHKDTSAVSFVKQQTQNLMQIGVMPGFDDPKNNPGSESATLMLQ